MTSGSSELKKFSHNLGQNWYHIVLVTKMRGKIFQWKQTNVIANRAFEDVCQKHSIDLFSKEVMPDHVHLFVSCPPNYSVRKLFQVLKGASSFYIRREYPSLKKFKTLWNRGTMYRSIGNVSADSVQNYIDKSNSWANLTSQRKLI
jgi:putative transposase